MKKPVIGISSNILGLEKGLLLAINEPMSMFPISMP